jgi:insertion element IS1 protein InsB
MECKFCNETCQKWGRGRQKNSVQGFYCKHCKKYLQKEYSYAACKTGLAEMIPKLVNNSVGIRGIARVTGIAVNTVMRLIRKVAERITKPPIPLDRKSFEIDEVRTFIGNKENQYWMAYVLCSDTKQVIDHIAGKRSKRTLRMAVNTAMCSGVKNHKDR